MQTNNATCRIQFNYVEDCYFACGVEDIFLISHNLMVWSLPFDMKQRPSPRLSINVTPSRCPTRTPAGLSLPMKQRLSHTYSCNKFEPDPVTTLLIKARYLLYFCGKKITLQRLSSPPDKIRFPLSSAKHTVFTSGCSNGEHAISIQRQNSLEKLTQHFQFA